MVTVFPDRAICMEQGGRMGCLKPGTLAALDANWLIVLREKQSLDGRRHGTMHRHRPEQLVTRALPPDA